MQNPGTWLQGIQYFRAIAIIEVIVLHTTVFLPLVNLTVFGIQKGLIVAVAAFTSVAASHFLFISGVVLYNKYSDGFSLSTFYKKRFRSVLPPYLVWSTLYYFYPLAILTLYTALFGPTIYASNSDFSLSGYLAALAVGIQQLWFVVLIMQLYLLYPLLVRVYNRFCKKNPIYILSLLLLAQVVYDSLFLTREPSGFNSFFLNGIFYFVFGFFVAERYGTLQQKVRRVSLKSISLVVVLSTICYAITLISFIRFNIFWLSLTAIAAPSAYIWLNQIVAPFYCLLLILFYMRISLEWGEPHGFLTRYLEKIGEDSFGIFLTHIFFIYAFATVLARVGLSYDSLLFYPVLGLLTLISSYWSVQVFYHLPFSNIIIGNPRKKKITS